MVKQKLRIINRKTLCRNISAKCNYVDEAIVNQVYSGLIKVIMDDLRIYDNTYLPDWGLFKIKNIKPRRRAMLRTKEIFIVPEHRELRFEPCVQLKYYVKNKL